MLIRGCIAALLWLVAPAQAEEVKSYSLDRAVKGYLATATESPNPKFETSWRNGPVFETEDGEYMLRLRARMLWDMVGRGSNTAVAVENRESYLRQGRIGMRGRIAGRTVFMIEVDFGNPDPPITNIPHWADTVKDPHGRATELRGIGETLGIFYATGTAENPCDGPCDEDDILP